MPDSQALAGVNIAPVRLSPLGQYLLSERGPLPAAGLNQMMEASGFDPRRDLQEILFSTKAQQPSGSALILVRGTFDVSKILAAAQASGATIETYKGVSIVEQSKRQGAAFPDSTLAILGDTPEVRAAIDRMSAPTSINSALAVLVNQVSLAEDIWFASMSPMDLIPQPAQGASNPLALYSKVQQVSGGIKFGANVVLSVQAVSQTAQDAAMLAALLKGLGMGLTGQSKEEMEWAAALLQSLTVTADGAVTTVSLSAPEAQLEQMIQAAHADHPSQTIGVDPRSRVAPPPAPLPPPQTGFGPIGVSPQRIRIGGNVQKAKLVQHAEPVYPPLALQARISGVVRINVVIGKDGTVENLTLASGHPLLVPAAMEAVKQWVYQPTLLNGQPVEVVTQVEVNFDLNQ
jgi:TonB family protein